MKLTKLATFKELRATGKYKFDFKGPMLGVTPIGQDSPTTYLLVDHLGQEVLVTEHDVIHPNVFLFIPELKKNEVES